MKSISFNNYNPADVERVVDHELFARVTHQVETALRHPYNINEEQADILQSYYPHRYVLQFTVGDLLDSQHPVLSAQNYLCNEEAKRLIARWKRDKYTVISIGDSANGDLGADHNCLLLNGARDLYRAASPNVKNDIRGYALGRSKHTTKCTQGVQNCHFKANMAVAVHSIYDITPNDMYQAFINHDLDTLIAYMYEPLFLHSNSYIGQDEISHKCHREGDKVWFSMHDRSVAYCHSYQTWRKWAVLSKIAPAKGRWFRRGALYDPDFDLVIERIRSHGPLVVLQIQRTARTNDILPYLCPISSKLKDQYLVPDIHWALKQKFHYSQQETPHYIVPATIVDAVLRYASRVKDESYQFVEFAAVLCGYSTQVVVNSKIYRREWKIDAVGYRKIAFSLFIIGAIDRARRTKDVSSAFSQLKYLQNMDFFSKSLRHLNDFITRIGRTPTSTDDNIILHRDLDSFTILTPKDILYRELEEVYPHFAPGARPVGIDDMLSDIPEDDSDDALSTSNSDDFSSDETIKNEVDCTKPTIDGEIDTPNSDCTANTTTCDEQPDTDARCDDVDEINRLVNDAINPEEPVIEDIITAQTIILDECAVNKIANRTEQQQELVRLENERRGNNNNKLNIQCDVPFDVQLLPSKFIMGAHCAMIAFRECFPNHRKPSVKEIIVSAYRGLRDGFTHEAVMDYIKGGDWLNGCSAIVIPTLAKIYHVNITIMPTLDKITSFPDVKTTYYINYANGHYSFLRAGAGIKKFDLLIDEFIGYIKNRNRVVELSAAPGYLINQVVDKVRAQKLNCEFHAGYYVGPSKTKKIMFTQKTEGIKISEFHHFQELFPNVKFDCIISDAARNTNSEQLVSEAIRYCKEHLKKGGTFVVKTFSDPHNVYQFAASFGEVKCHVTGVGSERYFILHDYCANKLNFYDIYDQYHVDETSHTYCLSGFDIDRFILRHFQSMKQFRPDIKIDCSKNYEGTFTAFTGYASASKTTTAIKKYPNAVFIAPSKELCERHNAMGVRSFTQHVCFGDKTNIKPDSRVIIDELSQFPVEFLALMQIMYPDTAFTVLGDIKQTKSFLDGFTSFESIGVINNMIDVYKIPQDIANSLNNKYGYNMRSKSDVKRGVYFFRYDDQLFSIFKLYPKLKMLTFNNASAKNLRDRGYNCSTVTTYTGSRDDAIVLHIDSAAIHSQFLNYEHMVYTACTRACRMLIFHGECDSFVNYFNFNPTMIETVAEFNEIYLHTENFNRDHELGVKLELTQHNEGTGDEPCDSQYAEMIIGDVVKPAIEAADTLLAMTTASIPDVKSGELRTTENAITPFPVEKFVTVASKHLNATINQMSSNSLTTIKTLVSRYSKKYDVNDKAKAKLVRNKLVNGLTLACFGTTSDRGRLRKAMYCTPDELSKNAFEYIKSLQDKYGDQITQIDDLKEIFDTLHDGKLSFFNKRQSKWKAEDAFDSKTQLTKEGQGVASFNKRVNLIYSCIARTMLDKMKKLLEREQRNIFLATHDSDEKLNDKITSLLTNRSPQSIYTCNDFSEWDASFREPFTHVTSHLMRAMGIKEECITWFQENRAHWSMAYVNGHDKTTLKGSEKQFSGNPFTICENTIGNMALCFTLFDYGKFDFALFKGDDSAVSTVKCIMRAEAKDIIKYTQHGLKLHSSPIGEFAGWFLTDSGLFPDVVRYTAKFLSKHYIDKEHFEEALQSLSARVVAVKNMKQLTEGCHITSAYYTELSGRPVSEECIRSLFFFIKGSKRVKFSDLETVFKTFGILKQPDKHANNEIKNRI